MEKYQESLNRTGISYGWQVACFLYRLVQPAIFYHPDSVRLAIEYGDKVPPPVQNVPLIPGN